MTRTSKNLSLFILFFALLWILLWARAAFADGLAPPDLPDVDTATHTIEWYGPLWGLALVISAVGKRLLATAEKEHWLWLASGRRFAIATALVTLLGAIALAGVAGKGWDGVVMTAIAMGFKVWDARIPNGGIALAWAQNGDTIAKFKDARDPQAGWVSSNVMLGYAAGMFVACGICCIMAVLFGACGPIRKAGDATKTAAIDCAKLDIVAHIPDVTKILEDGGASWKQQVEDLGVQIGEAELACTVRSVVAVLQHTQAATPDHNAMVSTPESRAVINGRTLIDEHGWSFAGAPLSMHEGRKAGATVRVERRHVVEIAVLMRGWGW